MCLRIQLWKTYAHLAKYQTHVISERQIHVFNRGLVLNTHILDLSKAHGKNLRLKMSDYADMKPPCCGYLSMMRDSSGLVETNCSFYLLI